MAEYNIDEMARNNDKAFIQTDESKKSRRRQQTRHPFIKTPPIFLERWLYRKHPMSEFYHSISYANKNENVAVKWGASGGPRETRICTEDARTHTHTLTLIRAVPARRYVETTMNINRRATKQSRRLSQIHQQFGNEICFRMAERKM